MKCSSNVDLFAVYYKQTADKTKVDLDEHRAKDVSCNSVVCMVVTTSNVTISFTRRRGVYINDDTVFAGVY